LACDARQTRSRLVAGAPRPAAPPTARARHRQVSPGLVVAGGRATFNGTPLMTPRGYVTLPREITDGSEIH
jgi:hypothetical protein